MKSRNIIGIVLACIILFACERPVGPVNPRPGEDTIPTTDTIIPPDTITPPDTIVPPDTIPIINDTIIIGTGGDDKRTGVCDYAPGEVMVLVKFYNPRQEEKVIVQHPIKEYDGGEGCYIYYENSGLRLNNSPVPSWVDTTLYILGTSPYIPLTDGYYLIDWKWQEYMPLWACSDSYKNGYHDPYSEHIRDHIFMTDINWTDLNNLSIKLDNSKYTQRVKGVEVIRVDYYTFDQLYNDIHWDFPVSCWMSIYCGGLSSKAISMYIHGACDFLEGHTYQEYIHDCDSLQDVYRQRLIEVINNGQLQEIAF